MTTDETELRCENCGSTELREELTGTYCVACDSRVDGTAEAVLEEARETDDNFGDDDDPKLVTDGGTETETETEVDGVLRIGPRYDADEHPATATITATLAPETSVYGDGRRVARTSGTMHIDGHDVPLGHHTGVGVKDLSDLPEDLQPDEEPSSFEWPTFVADDDRVIQNARKSVLDIRKDENAAIIEELSPSVTVETRNKSGRGEGSEIRAEGALETDDGRSLGMTWRNLHDFGHQVFTDEDDREAFDGDEMDALVQFATENSPVTRRMRM